MSVMHADGPYRRRLIMAIPVVWILFVGVLHWSGMIGQSNARAADQQPATPAQAAPNSQPAWLRDWPAPRRNVFLTRLDNFPRDVGTIQQPMRPTDPLPETKSPSKAADQSIVASPSGTATELGRIHLQSIMMHPVPRALVNGQIVSEGDFVGSFRVMRITLSEIVLDKQGVQYQITLK
jgi:hypothetical protein